MKITIERASLSAKAADLNPGSWFLCGEDLYVIGGTGMTVWSVTSDGFHFNGYTRDYGVVVPVEVEVIVRVK